MHSNSEWISFPPPLSDASVVTAGVMRGRPPVIWIHVVSGLCAQPGTPYFAATECMCTVRWNELELARAAAGDTDRGVGRQTPWALQRQSENSGANQSSARLYGTNEPYPGGR